MMNELGNKIALKRKNLGMTQIEFAEKLSVTRQTVSRWEAGTVMPDIDKIPDIASILGVSCDYLLKDEAVDEEQKVSGNHLSRLLKNVNKLGAIGKLNGLLGAVLSLAEYLIIVDTFFLIVMAIAGTPIGATLLKMIGKSEILTFFYEHNVLSMIWAKAFHQPVPAQQQNVEQIFGSLPLRIRQLLG